MSALSRLPAATVIFFARVIIFTAAAVIVAITLDEIACIAAENTAGTEGALFGRRVRNPGIAGQGQPGTPGVHKQALHWDGGVESHSSLVAVGIIFCVFCIAGVLSAIAFFIAARADCPDAPKQNLFFFTPLLIAN